MLSPRQIERLCDQKAYAALVERILANGRAGEHAVRRRLGGPAAAPVAGLGLALQRLSELTYGPVPAIASLTGRLLSMQRPGGLFARTALELPSVAASAVALRGLADAWGADRRTGWPAPRAVGAAGTALAGRAAAAVDEGLAAMRRLQGGDGLIGEDTVEAAVVLWQLGGVPSFRAAVRLTDLQRAVRAASDPELAGGLRRYALAAAA